jgi:hypothetical protein
MYLSNEGLLFLLLAAPLTVEECDRFAQLLVKRNTDAFSFPPNTKARAGPGRGRLTSYSSPTTSLC